MKAKRTVRGYANAPKELKKDVGVKPAKKHMKEENKRKLRAGNKVKSVDYDECGAVIKYACVDCSMEGCSLRIEPHIDFGDEDLD